MLRNALASLGLSRRYVSGDKPPARAETWYRKAVDDDPAQFSMLVLALGRQGDFNNALQICKTQAQKELSSRRRWS